MAYTDKDPTDAHLCARLEKPVFMATDKHARWWENNTIYKTNSITTELNASVHQTILLRYNCAI